MALLPRRDWRASRFAKVATSAYQGVMSSRSIWTLRASAVWAVWVWAVFIRNVVLGKVGKVSLAFEAVHIGLALISIAFAVITWRIATLAARKNKAQA